MVTKTVLGSNWKKGSLFLENVDLKPGVWSDVIDNLIPEEFRFKNRQNLLYSGY